MSETDRPRPPCVPSDYSSLLLGLLMAAPAALTGQEPVQLANVNRAPNAIGGSSDPVPLCATAQRAWFRVGSRFSRYELVIVLGLNQKTGATSGKHSAGARLHP